LSSFPTDQDELPLPAPLQGSNLCTLFLQAEAHHNTQEEDLFLNLKKDISCGIIINMTFWIQYLLWIKTSWIQYLPKTEPCRLEP